MYLAVINTWTIIVFFFLAIDHYSVKVIGHAEWNKWVPVVYIDTCLCCRQTLATVGPQNNVHKGHEWGLVVGGNSPDHHSWDKKKSNFIFYFCQPCTQVTRGTKISLLVVLDIISHLQIKSCCNNNFKVVNYYINNNQLQ